MLSAFSPLHRGGSGSPLVLLHGFTDTWRTWELVLPALERRHDVLAPTLLGHAGGPPTPAELTELTLAQAVERQMDEAGFETAHIVGNSLGGYLALHLATRGRALSVVALAPAGGWAAGDASFHETLEHFETMDAALQAAIPHADQIVSTPEGRRRASAHMVERYEHIPPGLLAHAMRGAAECTALAPLLELARCNGWPLECERVTCPVRVVWGTEDRLLTWPSAAARYRNGLPQAEWVEISGAGHCLQLDRPLEIAQLILGFTAR